MDYDNLIFLHIPKAAGSTLHPVLERHYSKRVRYTLPPGRADQIDHLSPMQLRRIRLLKGHMPFGLHRYLEGRSRYITLLRNPAERVVSHYYYVKRRPAHKLHELVVKGMSLVDYVSAGLSGELDNGQVRLLSGHDQDIPCGYCTRDLLDIARKNIEQHFAVVGLTERFDESLALMAVELGWSWTPYYLNRNVTQDKPAAKRIEPLTLQAIARANPLDFELYEWANQRFQDQITLHASEVEKVRERLLRANRLYRPWGSLVEILRQEARSRLAARRIAPHES